MTAGQIVALVSSAYNDYTHGWGVQGTRSGACQAIVSDLVSAGLVVDSATGEASLEARVERVLQDHVVDHDGDVVEDEFAEAVCKALGLLEVAA